MKRNKTQALLLLCLLAVLPFKSLVGLKKRTAIEASVAVGCGAGIFGLLLYKLGAFKNILEAPSELTLNQKKLIIAAFIALFSSLAGGVTYLFLERRTPEHVRHKADILLSKLEGRLKVYGNVIIRPNFKNKKGLIITFFDTKGGGDADGGNQALKVKPRYFDKELLEKLKSWYDKRLSHLEELLKRYKVLKGDTSGHFEEHHTALNERKQKVSNDFSFLNKFFDFMFMLLEASGELSEVKKLSETKKPKLQKGDDGNNVKELIKVFDERIEKVEEFISTYGEKLKNQESGLIKNLINELIHLEKTLLYTRDNINCVESR
jgi:hypothetical protein